MTEVLLTIQQDTDPFSPREDDNLGTMACWHRRGNFGDVQPAESPDDYRKENVPEGSVELPLFLFDHSGYTIRTESSQFRAADSHGWDWGQLGFIYCTPEKIKKEYSCPEITPEIVEKVKEVLRGEVKVYNQLLQGSVWGYILKKAKPACKECGHIEYEEDSCWGFFGETLEETGLLTEISADEALIRAAWEKRE